MVWRNGVCKLKLLFWDYGRRRVNAKGLFLGGYTGAQWCWQFCEESSFFWRMCPYFMRVFPACMSTHCSMQCLRGQERVGDSLSWVTDYERPCGCWKLNSRPLTEQQALLLTEPATSPEPERPFLDSLPFGFYILYSICNYDLINDEKRKIRANQPKPQIIPFPRAYQMLVGKIKMCNMFFLAVFCFVLETRSV